MDVTLMPRQGTNNANVTSESGSQQIDLEYSGHEFEATSELNNYYAWITEEFSPFLHGQGVEIGAGVGNYTKFLLPKLETIDLVEPSTKLYSALTEAVAGNTRATIHSTSLETFVSECETESRDTICMINVLEHIKDDATALRELHRILRPNGCICIFVPALSYLYSRFDEMVGHYRRYHLAPIKKLLSESGFAIEKAHYMDSVGIIPWGLINTLGRQTSLDPRMTKLYDNAIIPVVKRMETIVRPPLGKNILIVGRKT